jgi:hypothetical protein
VRGAHPFTHTQLKISESSLACLPGLPPGSIHVPYLSLPRRPPSLSCCCRARGQEGGGAGELDKPSGSSSAAADGPVRMKYRSTLTEENVAYLNKLDQYSSRPDSSGGCWAQLYLKFRKLGSVLGRNMTQHWRCCACWCDCLSSGWAWPAEYRPRVCGGFRTGAASVWLALSLLPAVNND